jgi:putative acetyltransferase
VIAECPEAIRNTYRSPQLLIIFCNMQTSGTIQILQASTPEHFDQVRKLIREFLKWHLQRHTDDIELINAYFDSTGFEEELASLPGKYSSPRGRLLLALYENQPAGCVALKEINTQACEMKRMFVYTQFQGKGIGHALARVIIDEARTIGFASMKLDTSFRQAEALRLYQRFGFKKIEAYYDLPEKMRNWLVFRELKL